jgi:hypothetical protein
MLTNGLSPLVLKQPLLMLLLLLLLSPMAGVPGQLHSALRVLLMLGMGVRAAGVALPSPMMLWRLLQGALSPLPAATSSLVPRLLCLLQLRSLCTLLLSMLPWTLSDALTASGCVGTQGAVLALPLLVLLLLLHMQKRPMPLPLLLWCWTGGPVVMPLSRI